VVSFFKYRQCIIIAPIVRRNFLYIFVFYSFISYIFLLYFIVFLFLIYSLYLLRFY